MAATPELFSNTVPVTEADKLKEVGNEHFRARRFDQAIGVYDQAIKLCPNAAVLFSNRAACYLEKHQFETARNDAHHARKCNPVFPRAHLRLGEALFGLGQLQDAYEAFDSAAYCARLAKLSTLESHALKRKQDLKVALQKVGKDPDQTTKPDAAVPVSLRMDKLAHHMTTFLQQALRGCERALFRTQLIAGGDTLSTSQSTWTSMSCSAFISYLNDVYKSLILGDDAFVVRTFSEFASCTDHSPVCLLNLLAQIGKHIIETDLPSLSSRNMDDLEKFTTQVDKCLAISLSKVEAYLARNLNHTCKGIDIKTCNPNEPMFRSEVKVH